MMEQMIRPTPETTAITQLRAEHVFYAYKTKTILDGVSMTVTQGDLIALLGKNGAGKTTLLKILQGFMNPSHGNIKLNQRPLTTFSRRELARYIAYVPQSHIPPFPYQTEEVVMMGRMPHRGMFSQPTTDDFTAVENAIRHLNIQHLQHRAYTELSGGERQLVLIARALAQGAKILIMDEPVTGLDYGNQIRLLKTLRQLTDEGFGVLFTTHHPEHALQIASRVDLLIDGAIAASGPARDMVTPAMIQRLYDVHVKAVYAEEQVLFTPV